MAISTRFAAALTVCLAVYVLLEATQTMCMGWASGGWNYYWGIDLGLGFRPIPLLVGCVLAAFAVGCDYWLPKRGSLLCWLALGTVMGLILRSFMINYSLAQMTQMDFWPVAMASSSPRDFLERWVDQHLSWPLHASINMPGMIWLLWEIQRRITSDPKFVGVITTAISGCGAVPLYVIIKSVYGGQRVALRAAVLYLFIPARLYFLPMMNTLSPVPILATLAMLCVCLRSDRHRLFGLLTGVGLYASMLFDPTTLALGLFFVAVAILYWRSKSMSRLEALLLYGLVGFFVAYVYMWTIEGFNLAQAIRASISRNQWFYWQLTGRGSFERTYGVWLAGNPYEFFVGAGVLPSLCCFTYLAAALTSVGACLSLSRALFLGALFLTLAILIASGIERGEVTRLWIFLMPFVQVVAADFCGRFKPRVYRVVLAGNIVQTAIGFAMVRWVW